MKRPWQSKINWIGLVVSIAGLAIDPTVQGHIGALVSQETLSKITACCGLLVMVIRTFCATQAIEITKQDGA